MKPTTIRYTGSLIGAATLVELAYYIHSTNALLAGLLYLMIANLLCIICVGLAIRLQLSAKKGNNLELAPSVLHIRAHALILAACQIAVIGTLNISAVTTRSTFFHLLLDYSAMIAFFFASYRIISIADSAEQDGGYILFNFIGYPRSRRFLFIVFAGYCTICPLTIMSAEVSIASNGWRPDAFTSRKPVC